jgi:uncharacterized protein (TIGR02646 family)
MKRILKNEEPIAFVNWKGQEAERLEPYYVANNADAAWGHLPSSPAPNPEPEIAYYSKRELANALLKEQGYLCCYCNRLIHNEMPRPNDLEHNDKRTSIEHLYAKESNARLNTFNYNNIAASCMGGEKRIPRFSYCNSRRGNDPLAILPTDENVESLVYYTLLGEIFGATDAITYTLHNALGLQYFDEARCAEIRAAFYENLDEYNAWDGENEEERPNLIPISNENARQQINELSQGEGNPTRYKEFCSAIISVLKREILGEQ